jgi:hypothetical protein
LGFTSSTLGLTSSTFGLAAALGASKISPQSVIMISLLVAPDWLPKVSIFFTIGRLSVRTYPNTTCLPSRWGVAVKQMKNWLPFVFFPEFAMDKIPAPVCLRVKFSSLNLSP